MSALADIIPGFARVEDAVTVLGARTANRIRPDLPTLVMATSAAPTWSRSRCARRLQTGAAAAFRRRADCASLKPARSRRSKSWPARSVWPRSSSACAAERRWPAAERPVSISGPPSRLAPQRRAPAPDRLPSEIWIIGMGNLGQVYLWTLGLLPCGRNSARLVLQDTDVVAPSNLSTSMLTTRAMVGRKKTRAMAEWADAREFEMSIVERDFAANFEIGPREPGVALIGVDNALARQAIEDVGFGRMIEAGLGRSPQDFLGIDLHTFPASRAAREVWSQTGLPDPDITMPVYRAMLERSGDRCGTVRLDGRSIGAPFVGSAAAALAIGELMRLCTGGKSYEVVSCHLRNLRDLTTVVGPALQVFNPVSITGSHHLQQVQ